MFTISIINRHSITGRILNVGYLHPAKDHVVMRHQDARKFETRKAAEKELTALKSRRIIDAHVTRCEL